MATARISVMVAGKGVQMFTFPIGTSAALAVERIVNEVGVPADDGDKHTPPRRKAVAEEMWESQLKLVGGDLVNADMPIAEYAGKELLLLQRKRIPEKQDA